MSTGISYKNFYNHIIKKVNPNFDMIGKDKSWHQKLLVKIFKSFNPKYGTAYYTQLYNRLYTPTQKEADGIKSSTNLKTWEISLIMHERQHMIQKSKSKIFSVKYLYPQIIFIIPLIITLLLLPIIMINLIAMIFGCSFFLPLFYPIISMVITSPVMIPKFIEAKWRYEYEIEAYKVSMLTRMFFGEEQGARWYISNVPKIMSDGSYYWTAPRQKNNTIKSLTNWHAALTARYIGESKLPDKFEAIWIELENLKNNSSQTFE